MLEGTKETGTDPHTPTGVLAVVEFNTGVGFTMRTND
jgi:hypothetical protein